MKKNILISLKLSLLMIILCSGVYPLLVALAGKASPGGGDGEKLTVNGKVVGYANIGQKFTEDRYFWGRPSAVDYNAAGSAGSNKGPTNPDYLKIVEDRLDTFLLHNPGIGRNQIPAEMVTASGSGLDPHISPASAYIQVARVARARNIDAAKLNALVAGYTEKHTPGPQLVNVLKLNIAVDALQ